MGFYLSPLVDVQEVDISSTIPAVSTSIGVILLRNTYKGPEMKTSFFSSEPEIIRTMGEPTQNLHCYRDMLSAFGFTKYGRSLYATRILPTDATFAGSKVLSGGFDDFDTPLTLADLGNPNDPEMGDPDEFADDIVVNDSSPLWIIAASRGEWGNNVKVSFCTKEQQNIINTTPTSASALDEWYPYETDGSTKPAWVGREDESTYFDILGIDSTLQDDNDFLIIVKEKGQGQKSFSTVDVWNVSTDPSSIDEQGRSNFVENVVNQQSNTIRVNLNDTMINQPWVIYTTTWEYLIDGSSGTIDTANGVSPSTQMVALDLYANPEEIDISLIIDGDKPTSVKKYMIQIAEDRKDCMAILDCPYDLVVNNRGNETVDLMNWRKGLGDFSEDNINENTSYASLYSNWMELYDQYSKKYRWIPTSGHVAGIYSKTDEVADPWWAPAGLNRAVITGIRRLAWNPQLGHRDMLYKNGLNPIVSFAGQGKVIWGQKTLLDKPSSFNRINVRRLFIVLEKAISTAAKYFLFEPNDKFTRLQLTNMIEPFLRDVKARRGVYDYKVICDDSNNTPERIDRNELWCTILIKPTRTAEFIVLQFVSLKTGASFEESASAVGIE